MNTETLKFFVQLANDQNFTKAANHLYISEQTLSNRIKGLEKYYGVKLFNRRPHTELTDSGKLVFQFAKHVIEQENDLLRSLNNINSPDIAQLKIGIQEDRASAYIVPVINELRRMLPGTSISIIHKNSLQLEKQVRENKVDFAFTINSSDNKNLHIVKVANKELCLVVSGNFIKNHLQTFIKGQKLVESINIDNLSGMPLVMINKSREATIIQNIFEQKKLHLNQAITINTGSISKDILKSGTVAMIAPKIPNRNYTPLKLFKIYCDGEPLTEEIDVIYSRDDNEFSNIITRMVKIAKKHI